MTDWKRATVRECVIIEDLFARLRRVGAQIHYLDEDTTIAQTMQAGGKLLNNDELWDSLPDRIGPDSKGALREWLRSELDRVR